jgi:hypothetical protein
MKVLKHEIKFDDKRGSDEIRIVFFGDVHLGHTLSSVGRFRERVVDEYAKDRNTYFVDMGDCIDGIISQTRDPRFKASQIDPKYVAKDNPIDLMIADYAKLVDPIKDRYLALLDSNHHLSISERTGSDLTRRIAEKLWPEGTHPGMVDRVLLGYSGFLVLNFVHENEKNKRRRSLVLSLCHGIGTGGKTEGGFITQLGHDASHYIADIHAYGHNHRLAGWDTVKIGVNKTATKILSVKEIRLCTGTYLKGFSDDTTTSYSEKARYKPNELGHMEIVVRFRYGREDIFWIKRGMN